MLLSAAAVTACSQGILTADVYAADESIETEPTAIFYVAPNYDPEYNGNGTFDMPFSNINEANEAIAIMPEKARAGGVTVYIRGGDYYQDKTLRFDVSGTDGGPIVYKAYQDEVPVIDGGYRLLSEDFRKPEASEVSCIKDETARNSVVVYDLKAEGLDVNSDFELYYDGNRGTLARYPNAWNPDEPPLQLKNVAAVGDPGTQPFTCDADEVISTWHSVEGVLLEGHFHIDWIQTSAVLSDYDVENSRITVSVTSENQWYREGGKYYFRNVLDEIDVPGEYYISPEGVLYFYPAGDIVDTKITYTQNTQNLVEVSADYVTFDGLTVENTGGSAFTASGRGITVQNCKIGCSGYRGLDINGYDNYIYNNEISHTGYAALLLSGGDTALGIPSNSVADNNYVHNFGEIKTVYEAGLYGYGVGFTFTHNEVAYSPHLAVSTDGRDMVMKYNYIHDVCREAGDAGAVYVMWWSNQGLVFENNFICNVYNMYELGAPCGFYCDDGGSGRTVRCNLFYNVAGNSIMIGGGKDNIITDNVIVKGPNSYTASLYYDSRTWYDEFRGYFVTFLNGIEPTNDYSEILWDDLFGESAYGTESWSIRYPRTMFYKTTTARDYEDRYMSYSTANAVLRNNVVYPEINAMYISKHVEKFASIRDNMYLSDIKQFGFADFENGDFTITENSLIYHDIPGFKAYDFREIGRHISLAE
ncbi:MAG: right-handed parallel beta-helix repeat-containing protein [Clostridia bacterium]|nr:right-handed parallel beta-helix repeat-containing protein [Clostridia bacterium]